MLCTLKSTGLSLPDENDNFGAYPLSQDKPI